MKRKCNLWMLIVFSIVFIACSDDKVDSSIISNGSVMSKEAREIEQNLDKASYAELADLFLDTKDISFDKDVMLVFGKNNCTYCDILKEDIKKNSNLKQRIKDNFNPYYINTSYSKKHKIDWNNKQSIVSTQDFARIFSVNATPTIVFLSKNGSVKYMYPGYTPQFEYLVEAVIQQDNSMGSYSIIDSKLKAL